MSTLMIQHLFELGIQNEVRRTVRSFLKKTVSVRTDPWEFEGIASFCFPLLADPPGPPGKSGSATIYSIRAVRSGGPTSLVRA